MVCFNLIYYIVTLSERSHSILIAFANDILKIFLIRASYNSHQQYELERV